MEIIKSAVVIFAWLKLKFIFPKILLMKTDSIFNHFDHSFKVITRSRLIYNRFSVWPRRLLTHNKNPIKERISIQLSHTNWVTKIETRNACAYKVNTPTHAFPYIYIRAHTHIIFITIFTVNENERDRLAHTQKQEYINI